MRQWLLALVLLPLARPAAAQGIDEWLAKAQREQPRAVFLFLERRLNCAHLAGEEATNAERAAFLRFAVENLRCATLPTDEAKLRRRHASQRNVIAALNEARDRQW